MNGGEGGEAQQKLEADLDAIATQLRTLAERHRGDSIAILTLLRTLEKLHHEIRETLFQESLPNNRQALYRLLRNIESTGGWPYIYRMKLQALLSNLQTSSLLEDEKLNSPGAHPKNLEVSHQNTEE